MKLLRIAAFSDTERGGNPAGVLISDCHPDEDEMRRIAAEVGYSETAFAMPQGEDMGMRSRLRADISPEPGSSIRVSGSVRIIEV